MPARLRSREVRKGSVLFCAGENPDDIRARYIVLAERMGFDPVDVPIHFINGVVNIEASFDRIKAEAEAIDDLLLVIVDTAAAYFPGDEPNNNAQQVAFARTLRRLTIELPTKPAVIVNCHPVKNAAKDNLIPMGGSAFLNEVDGNLTLWKTTDTTTELYHQGKFRGPEFQPITFTMETVKSGKVVDDKGREASWFTGLAGLR
jgi:RecA-family ATPase